MAYAAASYLSFSSANFNSSTMGFNIVHMCYIKQGEDGAAGTQKRPEGMQETGFMTM
jgi:hypothetical protein